jgi:diguanylate cyclase (GGDEF)-like protein
MIDVDHFKAINDRYGHAEGDRVLKCVAQALRDGLRARDVVARWGGEEFCVVLPATGLAEARTLADRLLHQIASSVMPRVTVSVGICEAGLWALRPEDVIGRADKALYLAKEAGRNRIVLATDVNESIPAASPHST